MVLIFIIPRIKKPAVRTAGLYFLFNNGRSYLTDWNNPEATTMYEYFFALLKLSGVKIDIYLKYYARIKYF